MKIFILRFLDQVFYPMVRGGVKPLNSPSSIFSRAAGVALSRVEVFIGSRVLDLDPSSFRTCLLLRMAWMYSLRRLSSATWVWHVECGVYHWPKWQTTWPSWCEGLWLETESLSGGESCFWGNEGTTGMRRLWSRKIVCAEYSGVYPDEGKLFM